MDSSSTDPALLAGRRERALASRDDAALLEARELELALRDLPPVVGGVRRTRLVAADPISTTWEGWDVGDGGRLLLRCVRPGWRHDPVMLRRLALAAGPGTAAARPTWVGEGEWPHLRLALRGPLLGDFLPVEDPADSALVARVLAAGLLGLRELHAEGLVHGSDPRQALELGPRPRLLWLDPFRPSGGPRDDLIALARAAAALDPEGTDPIGALAWSWVEEPPPSAADGARMLREAMADALASTRHQVAIASRHAGRRARAARLSRAVRALSRAVRPPRMRACVHAGTDGVLVMVESDGGTVRGGPATLPGAAALPVLWTSNRGLEVAPARQVLRAWATRGRGDEAARARVQASIDADDARVDLLARWISGQARLRAAMLLLRAVGTGG